MAPDFVCKRSLGRAVTGHTVGGMLLLQHRRSSAAAYAGLSGYLHPGTAGGLSSSATGASVRHSATPTVRAHSSRRINHPRHTGQHKILLGTTRQNAGARTSDELAARLISAQDVCDNSNDSGLGFEERQQQQQLSSSNGWNGAGEEDSKRRRMDIKLESEDANFAFPEVQTRGGTDAKGSSRGSANSIGGASLPRSTSGGVVGRVVGVTRPRPAIGVLGSKRSTIAHQGPITLTSQLCSASRDGKTQLQIICQPEQQHRARYQTEGSRGAVKDRTGNGFPIVRLIGYEKPATLQIFIGTDLGRVAPHMFYQACRVSGKNSTPCVERKVDGTIVIEVDMDPTKEMLVTCDCVGILKERNVDVEHRFPQEAGVLQGRSKKKSTRCRMVFRTNITHSDGTSETLQVCSQPIVCTQPPGIPEISKKSLTSCPCTGGLELFVLGKNFLKDTRIVFQLDNEDLSSSLEPHWECAVLPDKEFLQQTHLVCVVPPYRRQDLEPAESVSVKLYAVSSGKTSEPHTFLYTAASAAPEPSIGKIESSAPSLTTTPADASLTPAAAAVTLGCVSPNSRLPPSVASASSFVTAMQQQQQETLKSESCQSPSSSGAAVTPVMMWASQAQSCQNACADVMMPPPPLVANPIINRRSSSNLQLILPDNLKTEVLDENSQNSMMSENSMQSLPNSTSNAPQAVSSPLQLSNEASRDAPASLMGSTNVTPAQDAAAAGLLGVAEMIHQQHPLALDPQDPFGTLHESPQVKVLSPHHINKDSGGLLSSGSDVNSPVVGVQGAGVVDLRMKQHQSDFTTLTTFATTAPGQSLPAQSGHSIEKYLNHIESTASQVKENDVNGAGNAFVGGIQQRASIISTGRQQQQQPPDILAPTQATVKLDALVNSAAETHQIGTSLQTTDAPSGGLINHVSVSPGVDAIHRQQHEVISSPTQNTRTSPPIPVKAMILEALIPSPTLNVQAMTPVNVAVSPSNGSGNDSRSSNDSLLTTIAAALLPPMQEPPVVTAAGAAASPTCVSANHQPLQVPVEPIPSAAEQIQQMQALAQQDAAAMQQVQQVEQVMAQAQQQVEQLVAQAQQQAVQAVQQAQQQVVQQVVQHAHVVQQAVQQVQAVPAVQQAVQQATQEVVQQAVQQATHEVVQQVQAVQQAVQQAQAAQAMQHAVQQDISSMLSQPAGFVAEASSALASGAAQEPSQQRLTTAAEQAINSVITNATQDIINNRPITTTTAHAIIATKNILNSVATQSAQLMNTAMEGILPKSPTGQSSIVEQVTNKSATGNNGQVNVNVPVTSNGVVNQNNGVTRKPEDAGGMLPQELTSMSEHDLLSYINPSCFDQGGFLM